MSGLGSVLILETERTCPLSANIGIWQALVLAATLAVSAAAPKRLVMAFGMASF